MDDAARALERALACADATSSARSRARLDAVEDFSRALEARSGSTDGSLTTSDDVRRCEDALVRAVRAPVGNASSARAAMALVERYRGREGGSMWSRANELLDAATRSSASAFERSSALEALTRVVREFGGKLVGAGSSYAKAACGIAKPNEDARCKRAALRLFAATCARAGGGIDAKSAMSFYKTIVRLEADASAGVRAACAEALGALVFVRGRQSETSAGDVDVNAVAERILSLLADDDARVRDVASSALTNVALSCVRSTNDAAAEESHGTAESHFAYAVRAFMYDPFKASIRGRSVKDQRVSLGVARAWAAFNRRVVREEDIEQHDIAVFTVKTLLAEELDDNPHACACATYVIRTGCLLKADEASLRATLSTVVEAFTSTDVFRLLVSARATTDTIQVIGSADEELWVSTMHSVLQLLRHPDRHVQAEASLALRALALACPTKFVSQLYQALAELDKFVTSVDAPDSILACGLAFHIAALVSIGAEFSFGLPSSILRGAAALGIRCATGPGSARVREGGWIVIAACLVGSGAAVASEMCGVSIKFALTATFDAVVESGVESEPGEIYAAAAAAEALSAWLIGEQSQSSSLTPLLLSAVTATERIISAREGSLEDQHAKSLFRFRVFELLNSVQNTSFYADLHARIVSLCHRASQSNTRADVTQPENFLKSQLSTEDAHLGPWMSHADANFDELCMFEGSVDSPHPRVWIGLSEGHVYPRSRSMRASTRQAEGVQISKLFSASPHLRISVLYHFLNTAHRLAGTTADGRELSERGVYTPKKQSALDVIQSRAISAFGSPFKGRRSKVDELEELGNRHAMLTLLCADVLAAVKHMVEHTKTRDAQLMKDFKKIANVMQCTHFASTKHWRAIAEIHGYANVLNPDPDALLRELVESSKEALGTPNDSPIRSIIALSIAATFRNASAMTLRQACTPVVTNLLQMSMNVDHAYASHIWSSHCICVIGTHSGQTFVRDAEDSVNLAFALADAPFLLEEENGPMTRVTAARLVNTAISAVGPDLDHGSLFFKRSEGLMKILCDIDDPAAQLESTTFLQHIATFTPRTPKGRGLVAKLRLMLKTSIDSSNTEAVMLTLRHLLERDGSVARSQTGLDLELLTVLDRESDPSTRTLLKRCVELLILDLCERKPIDAMQHLSNVALYTSNTKTRPEVSSAVLQDDEEAEADLASLDEDEHASEVERGAPKLSTRLYAAQLLAAVPTMLGKDERHKTLTAARKSFEADSDDRWLSLHAQRAFDIAYRLCVSPISALHAPGLDMFSNLMNLWAKDLDPDSLSDADAPAVYVLEQYQAQLLSAMRATDPENASLESFLALLRLVSSALTSGIAGEDAAMTKRLGGVVTKIAREMNQGTSDILCGKVCDEAVAVQAKETLVINIARIASSAPGVVPDDVLEFMSFEWITAIRNPSGRCSDDDLSAIMSACSMSSQNYENTSLIRELCFKALICGFNNSRQSSTPLVMHAIRTAKNVIRHQDVGILSCEVRVMRDVVIEHPNESVRQDVIALIEDLETADKIHPNALVDTIELSASLMSSPIATESQFSRLFIVCMRLSRRSKRAARGVGALVNRFLEDVRFDKYKLVALRSIRLAEPDLLVNALTSYGHSFAGCARRLIKAYYACVASERAPVEGSLEFVSESLQTWAAVFLLLKDDEDETKCLRPLAIFLAIAVEVTAPNCVPESVVDATVGLLASQILVKLAAVCPEPFRSVVGQLSDASKARLQVLLRYKPTQHETPALMSPLNIALPSISA